MASKLLYAAKFYCMPKPFYTALQKQFTQFVNWPREQGTVNEAELFKMRPDGGLQLLHLLTKSQASKCAWLVRLLTLPALALNLTLFTALFGEQPSNKQGVEILFSPHSYARGKLRFPSHFYKEAVLAFTSLSLQQHVPLEDVPQQLYFYSRIFVDAQGDPIPNTLRGAKRIIFRFYQQFLDEQRKRDTGRLADQDIVELHAAMHTIHYDRREHAIVTNAAPGYMPLRTVSERDLYYELLHPQYRLHHSTLKWQEYFGFLDWSKIWAGVHNPLANETTRSMIWEHLHLNFPTTYTMNKFYKRSDPCPLSGVVPFSRKHLIIPCPFVQRLWSDLSPFLHRVHPGPVTEYEMVFGLEGNSPPIVLRNWLTFKLRQVLFVYAYQASLQHVRPHLHLVKSRFNQQIYKEVLWKYRYCLHTNTLDTFRRQFQWGDHHLVKIAHPDIAVVPLFPL